MRPQDERRASAFYALLATFARTASPLLLAVSAAMFAGAALVAKTAQVLPQFLAVAIVSTLVNVLNRRRRSAAGAQWRQVSLSLRHGSRWLYVARSALTAAAFVLLALASAGLLSSGLSVGYASMATALVGAASAAMETTGRIVHELRASHRRAALKQAVMLLPVLGCAGGVFLAFGADPAGLANRWVALLGVVIVLRAVVPFLQSRIAEIERVGFEKNRAVELAITTKATLWLGLTVALLYAVSLAGAAPMGWTVRVHFATGPALALAAGVVAYVGYAWAWQHANGMAHGSQSLNGLIAVMGTPIGFGMAALIELPSFAEAIAQLAGSACICVSLVAKIWLTKRNAAK